MFTEYEEKILKLFVEKLVAETKYTKLAVQKDTEFKEAINPIRDQINLSHETEMKLLADALNLARSNLKKECE